MRKLCTKSSLHRQVKLNDVGNHAKTCEENKWDDHPLGAQYCTETKKERLKYQQGNVYSKNKFEERKWTHNSNHNAS